MEPVKDICMRGRSQGKRCGWIQSWNLFSYFENLFSLSRSTFQYPENWGTLKEKVAVLMNVMSKIANIVNSCRKVTLAEDDFFTWPLWKKTFSSICFINVSILINLNFLMLHPMSFDFILGIFSGLFLFSKLDCNSLRVSDEWEKHPQKCMTQRFL